MNIAQKLKVKWAKQGRHCITAHLLHDEPRYYILIGIVPYNTVQYITVEHSKIGKLESEKRTYVN